MRRVLQKPLQHLYLAAFSDKEGAIIMILSVSFQAKLFLTTIFCGFLTGFFYDLIRIFRLMIKHKKIFIALEDGIYWLLVSVIVFFVMLIESFGEIRIFSIVGVFMGMVFYFLTISPLVLRCAQMIINITKRILLLFLEIILTPFRLLLMIFSIPAKKIYHLFKIVYRKLLHSYKICAKIGIHNQKYVQAILHKKLMAGVGIEKRKD